MPVGRHSDRLMLAFFTVDLSSSFSLALASASKAPA